jgi:prefoldin subunit 5
MAWWSRWWTSNGEVIDWLRQMENRIMARIDEQKAELEAALVVINERLDQVGSEVAVVGSGVKTVAEEVAALIARLGEINNGSPVNLDGVLAQAKTIGEKLAEVDTSLDAVRASLSAVPPAPTA